MKPLLQAPLLGKLNADALGPWTLTSCVRKQFPHMQNDDNNTHLTGLLHWLNEKT